MKYFKFAPSADTVEESSIAFVLLVMYMGIMIASVMMFIKWRIDMELLRLTISFVVIALLFAHLNYKLER